MKNLKRLYPDNPLVLLCRSGLGDFFLDKKLVDEVFEVGKKPATNWAGVRKDLGKRKFKFVVSPHQSFRTAWFVSRLKAEKKIGYKKWWNSFAFDLRIFRPMNLPEVLRQMALIRHLDGAIDQELNRSEDLNWADPANSPAVPYLFSLQFEADIKNREKIIYLSPGSEWPTKRWREDGFVKIGKYYRAKGYFVAVTGTSAEKELNAKISSQIDGARDFTGKTTITELYEKFRKGTLLITNDNGASHIASCAGLPVIAVFGPTMTSFGYRPWIDKARIAQADVSCRPCSAHGTEKCPLGTHECMKKVSSEHIVQKADELGVFT
ncbi:MAG: hypothetical protein A4S09_12605 [Proteobacteria bacterium SG_bin7]|nr:MAG: hypothetical protein A4S09_12605 [Proteobacteria bacterium SG_bin7]